MPHRLYSRTCVGRKPEESLEIKQLTACADTSFESGVGCAAVFYGSVVATVVIDINWAGVQVVPEH